MTKTITKAQLIDGARTAVLAALDEYMENVTGHIDARGWRDCDLPVLFAGLDAHMDRVAERFSNPESLEVGSAYLRITTD